MTVEIRGFDFRNATAEEFAPVSECRNRIRAEQFPDDPPIPLEETMQGFRNFPSFLGMSVWVAAPAGDDRLAGQGLMQYSLEDNLHMAQFFIGVLPEHRRQGLARRLLARIVQAAEREQRRLLITSTMARIPAGKAFMKRLGAEEGLKAHTNQLALADLDRELVDGWQARASERASAFEIGYWDGVYPDEYIQAIVELYDLLNQQPFGDLEIEDFSHSAENIRQSEKSLFSRGYERWTLYVREKKSKKFAGYTEVLWNPNRPDLISQGITGVFPQYRGKGLGRWLKAEMLERVLAERPQARFVRTENADINAPMMKINKELGFKPYIAESVWQLETEKARAYLEEQG